MSSARHMALSKAGIAFPGWYLPVISARKNADDTIIVAINLVFGLRLNAMFRQVSNDGQGRY